jgi:hypothetical protein
VFGLNASLGRPMLTINRTTQRILFSLAHRSCRKMSKEGVSSSVFDVDPKDTLFAKMIRGDIKVH